MKYCELLGEKVSQLGFGCMRFPLLENGEIDREQTKQLIDYAMQQGVNYFDTAYPYLGGYSEIVLGEILREYPRNSYYLASKYPGHQIAETYDPAAIFEEQLAKCGVDYFDFYLLHNVNEGSVGVYLDPQWNIVDYFVKQKRLGRIKHLGFSCHGGVNMMQEFLDATGDAMEFCQIQLNWLDWTLQQGREKVELLNTRNVPIIVMEPVRGGYLCTLSKDAENQLHALRPEESIASWSFRFLQDIPGVACVLSGMSNMEQLQDNVSTFSGGEVLTNTERALLLEIAEGMKDSVPCTTCCYCADHCPVALDIPTLISIYNELCFKPDVTTSMRLEFLPEAQLPSACIACGACAQMCPQGIDIPHIMDDLAEKLVAMPKWAAICKEREEAARKLKANRA